MRNLDLTQVIKNTILELAVEATARKRRVDSYRKALRLAQLDYDAEVKAYDEVIAAKKELKRELEARDD